MPPIYDNLFLVYFFSKNRINLMASLFLDSESDEEDYVYVDSHHFGGNVELQLSDEEEELEHICFDLFCNVCAQKESDDNIIFTVRGCPVSLVANEEISLFSSDVCLPSVVVETAIRPIHTCDCKISTLTCRWCNSRLGYKVVEPCTSCLSASNNGHYYMFSSPAVASIHRTGEPSPVWLDDEGILTLSPSPEEDTYYGDLVACQNSVIAREEENRNAATNICKEKLEILRSFAEKSEHENILETDMLEILSYFQEFVCSREEFVCSREEFVAIVKNIRSSKRIKWTKELAKAFGCVLKGYKSMGNGKQKDSRSNSGVTPEDDPSFFWST